MVAYTYDRNGNLLVADAAGPHRARLRLLQRAACSTRYTPPLVGAPGADDLHGRPRRAGRPASTRPAATRRLQLRRRGAAEDDHAAARRTTHVRLRAADRPPDERDRARRRADRVRLRRRAADARRRSPAPSPGAIDDTYDDDLRLASETVGGATASPTRYDDDGLLIARGRADARRTTPPTACSTRSAPARARPRSPATRRRAESASRRQGAATIYARDLHARRPRPDHGQDRDARRDRATHVGVRLRRRGPAGDGQARRRRRSRPTSYDANGNRHAGHARRRRRSTSTYDAPGPAADRSATRTYTYTAAGELRTKTDGAGDDDLRLRRARRADRSVTLPGGTQLELRDRRRRPARRRSATARPRGASSTAAGSARWPSSTPPATRVKSRFVYATRSNVPGPDGPGRQDLPDRHRPARQPARGRRHRHRRASCRSSTTTSSAASRATRNPGFQPFGFAGGLYDRDTEARALRRARLRPGDRALHGARTRCASAAASTNLYGYALDDPVNLTDPSGQILDTILDLGFIALRPVPDRQVADERLRRRPAIDVAALGADVAGALIPFATGGGAAVRAGRAGDRGHLPGR